MPTVDLFVSTDLIKTRLTAFYGTDLLAHSIPTISALIM